MNGKIITGALGLVVVFFLLMLGLTLIMPQAQAIMSDANIDDYVGLETITGASITIITLAVLGFSIYSLWTGIRQRGGGARVSRKRA